MSQLFVRMDPWLRSRVSIRPGAVRREWVEGAPVAGMQGWRLCASGWPGKRWHLRRRPNRGPIRGWPMLLRPERWRMRRLRLMSCLLLGLILPMLVMRWCGLRNSSGWGVGAARAALVGSIQRQVLHTADGHGSAKIMVRHVARLTEAEALARAKTARLAADVPKVTAGRGRPVRCRRVRCGRWGGWMRTLGSLQRYVSVTTSFWLMPKRWVRRRLGTRCTGGHG